MIIEKKVWPEFFSKLLSGEKTFELRLADFNVKAGDTLLLKEYDPKTGKFTGRKIEKACKSVMKVNPTDFYSPEQIREHGLLVIGL